VGVVERLVRGRGDIIRVRVQFFISARSAQKDLAVPGELARFSPTAASNSTMLQADVCVLLAGTLASSSFNPSDIVG
jgi:hypothetical protein